MQAIATLARDKVTHYIKNAYRREGPHHQGPSFFHYVAYLLLQLF